jgi:hypothetical protein
VKFIQKIYRKHCESGIAERKGKSTYLKYLREKKSKKSESKKEKQGITYRKESLSSRRNRIKIIR